MPNTGQEFVVDALHELGVLDPVQTIHPEQLAHGLRLANDLLDSWRADKLTIGGVTISTYSLVTTTQT